MASGTRPGPGGDRLGQEDDEVRSAIRFAAVVTAVGVIFVLLAAWWVSSCGPAVQTLSCGRPYRALLAVGAPAIFAGGGLVAFMRTYRVWRRRGTWWGWQGAGWFLMTLMVATMFVTTSAVMGQA